MRRFTNVVNKLDKSKIMHFGYNNPNNIFLLGVHILETVDEEKDLGVIGVIG